MSGLLAGAAPLGARLRQRLAQGSYSDVLLAFAAVAIIALIIVPLPTTVIDALVAINIAFGFGLLMIAIYIPGPTAFSAFPSVLLLSTLFRLALSISITRLILLDADAGDIVEAFGRMVAGGNLIVGLVMFTIITVVQFIVVAKGAERVAEVAARFSLDAMPGKQLSIDSDLRSGIIDKDEARSRRRKLELESQLNGSLDGAMKYVKGDAIVGIVIIIINLVAGLAIGVLQRGMPLGEAAETYSILTIGDGLVAQIPALLSAIAAGLFVTRVAGDPRDRHLGAAISRQVAGEPRVFLITGGLSLVLMLVPGFPSMVFLALALVLLSIAAWRYRFDVPQLRRLFRVPAGELSPEATQAREDAGDQLQPPLPLALRVSSQLLQDLGGSAALEEALRHRVRSLREASGVPYPAARVRADDGLSGASWRLDAHGVRLGDGRIPEGQGFAPSGRLGAQVETGLNPPLPGAWQAATSAPWADQTLVLAHCELALRRRAGRFIGIQETAELINQMSRDYGELVKEMLRVLAPQRVAEVLRSLAAEGVVVRNLRDIFEALTEHGANERDTSALVEQVRSALKREICEAFADADGVLHVLLVQPELEDTVRQAVRQGAGGSQLAMPPDAVGRLIDQVRAALEAAPSPEHLVLLCSQDVRRHLRRLLELDFFELPVMSYQELVPELRVHQAGQVGA
ncbi:MAG: type III secretion system export apparatus subunit SctV [Lysobacteraceae bacterium]